MNELHQLIVAHGVEGAAALIPPEEKKRLRAAAAVLADDSSAFGITYSGFCLTSLPHRRLPTDDDIWIRKGSIVSLQISPGALPQSTKRIGVPYGAKARLILLYLQTQAIKYSNREIELGRSMFEWMDRMGIGAGGKQYSEVREQAKRLSRCTLTFSWNQGGGKIAFEDEKIISEGSLIPDSSGDGRQGKLWVDTVTMSEKFFNELKVHGVPVADSALRELSGQSVALDVYVWLAYRLHSLEKPQSVSWQALYQQFGASYADLRFFKRRFTDVVKDALAVYPGARVDLDEAGLVLYPSPSPVTPRIASTK